MITIDGAQGEGGGQIVRTSLALSLVTGLPFRLERIRAGRKKPGLLHQHLTAVEAARAVGSAEVNGAGIGSQFIEFRPGPVKPGSHHFAVGTAGSATLVLQTILPPLLIAPGASAVTLEGGTHNPFAPPFDFLALCFAPVIQRMGARFELKLERPGFYPAGGGRLEARIEPAQRLARFDLLERGPIARRQARAIVSRLPPHIAERELAVIREMPGWREEECRVETVTNSPGPGNALLLELEAEQVTGVFTGFGERGRSAEAVARDVGAAAKAWLDAEVPVDEHLADQLLLPMALAGGGSFRTTEPSSHSTTNASVIQQFLPVDIEFEQETAQAWRIVVSGQPTSICSGLPALLLAREPAESAV